VVPAVANAVRNATGLALPTVPIRPDDIALGLGSAPTVTWTKPRAADPSRAGTTVVDEQPVDALGTMAEEGAPQARR
jgi:hypothetical protein